MQSDYKILEIPQSGAISALKLVERHLSQQNNTCFVKDRWGAAIAIKNHGGIPCISLMHGIKMKLGVHMYPRASNYVVLLLNNRTTGLIF